MCYVIGSLTILRSIIKTQLVQVEINVLATTSIIKDAKIAKTLLRKKKSFQYVASVKTRSLRKTINIKIRTSSIQGSTMNT